MPLERSQPSSFPWQKGLIAAPASPVPQPRSTASVRLMVLLAASAAAASR